MDRVIRQNAILKLLKEHIWGVLLIVVLLIGSNIAVKAWKAKHPGAMSVIEAQAMDMTAMKPPKGAVPVATEVVTRGGFSAKVTYTGSVAPYTEQNIYPRVEGWLKDLHVYNGDKVVAGKLLAVIDSPDLQNKVAEASAGHAAAASEISVAQSGTARMSAEKAAAQGEVETAKSELAGAKARLVATNRAVTQTEKEIKSAKANLEYHQAEIKRMARLLKEGAVSLQEYQSEKAQAVAAEADVENREARLEEARANVQAAKAEVSAKQAMIGIAKQRVAAADAAVSASHREVTQKSAAARQAGAMVGTASTIDSYRYIRAPFAGVVTKRYLHPGVFVRPSDAVLNLVQIDKVRLQANVADKDLDRIHVGAPVVARLPKDPNKAYYAKVTSVSPMADQSSRTATVEAVIDNPGHKLGPGDFVTMEISASAVSDQFSVPASALVRKDGRDAIWIVKNEAPKGKMTYYCTMHPEVTSENPNDLCPKCNMKLEPKTSSGGKKAHLVFVTPGNADGERREILSGLNDGDEIIHRGHTYLKEDDTVFPTKWGEDGPQEMPEAPGMSGGMPGHGGHSEGNHDDSSNTEKMDHESTPEMDHSKMDHSKMDHSKMDQSKPAEKPVKKSEKGDKVYTCPMHPEVVSHKPGDTCPDCGMFLEEKK